MLNADLIVQGRRADQLDLAAFTDAEEMVNWEMAAYAAYGDARCEAENIETITDLFGKAFAATWNKHHNMLLARHHLQEALADTNALVHRINRLCQVMADPPEAFPYYSQEDTAMPEKTKKQVIAQCRVVAHLARQLAIVHENRVNIYTMRDRDMEPGLIEVVGGSSANAMMRLADVLNGMDAMDEDEDAWTYPIIEAARVLWPDHEDDETRHDHPLAETRRPDNA